MIVQWCYDNDHTKETPWTQLEINIHEDDPTTSGFKLVSDETTIKLWRREQRPNFLLAYGVSANHSEYITIMDPPSLMDWLRVYAALWG